MAGAMLCHNLLSGLLVVRLAPEQQPAAQAAFNVVAMLGRALGPLAASLLYDTAHRAGGVGAAANAALAFTAALCCVGYVAPLLCCHAFAASAEQRVAASVLSNDART